MNRNGAIGGHLAAMHIMARLSILGIGVNLWAAFNRMSISPEKYFSFSFSLKGAEVDPPRG